MVKLKEGCPLCGGVDNKGNTVLVWNWCGRPCMNTPGAEWKGIRPKDWKPPSGLVFRPVIYFDRRKRK